MTERQDLPSHLLGRPFAVARGVAAGISTGRMLASDLARPFWGVRACAPVYPS